MSQQPVILKLGGSLLSSPDLMERLQTLLDELQQNPVLIIVGGGVGADLIRDLDQRFGLSAEKAHWDAIAAMTSNAALLSRLCPSLQLVVNRDEASRVWAEKRVALLDVFAFLKDELRRTSSDSLPASWEVTSDSIARWTAIRWPAVKLILAKSCEPASLKINELVAGGSLDSWFTHVCGECSVEWLNLRNKSINFVPLQFPSSSGTGSRS